VLRRSSTKLVPDSRDRNSQRRAVFQQIDAICDLGTTIMENFPRMMRMKHVLSYLGCSKSHIYRLIERGELPPGRKVGTNFTWWPKEEIDRYVDRLIEK
jgi:excisionase family DNA binding protein